MTNTKKDRKQKKINGQIEGLADAMRALKNLVKIKFYETCSFTNYFIPKYDGGLLLNLGSGSSQFFYAA